MSYVGVDPGASGGIAWIKDGEPLCWKMPDTERDTFELLRSIPLFGACHGLIEKVSAFPGQGVSSSFKFGMSYGGLRMALVAAGIPFETVTPNKWQRALGIPKRGKDEPKTKYKGRLRAKAQELFPGVKVTLAVADALLIAEYARRTGAWIEMEKIG